ncbi:hypothetical protein FRACA_50016 [Frankia canadensis]|uniref:Uncharacterized protein n=1 Tax=Frankia canadensis TaxID=1836972 RepID=A0A2I2KY94_9ACTN|nr:hypothetical protein FRACA_50016 [Frankia canadensis]SOU57918.1 hypothetical protein FRACA_50016 [Frankia canadensis]
MPPRSPWSAVWPPPRTSTSTGSIPWPRRCCASMPSGCVSPAGRPGCGSGSPAPIRTPRWWRWRRCPRMCTTWRACVRSVTRSLVTSGWSRRADADGLTPAAVAAGAVCRARGSAWRAAGLSLVAGTATERHGGHCHRRALSPAGTAAGGGPGRPAGAGTGVPAGTTLSSDGTGERAG